VLADPQSPENKYKFAQVCMKLNKFSEAEKTLLGKLPKTSRE